MAVSDVHPGSERLAQYAERALTQAERLDVERHLADCARCRQVLVNTVTVMAAERPDAVRLWDDPFPRWMIGIAAGLATAAILVLAIRIVHPEWLRLGPRTDRPELRELVAALANEPTRPIEGRLTGGFKYAPPSSPRRGPTDSVVSPDVTIAVATLEKRAAQEGTLELQRELAVGYVVVGELDKAIPLLEAAARRYPEDATIQSDLAVAYVTRAQRTGQTEADARNALECADRALHTAPALQEAAYNRALALDLLHRRDQAADAWRRYAQSGPSDGWTVEAQGKLQQEPQSRTRNDIEIAL